MRKKMLLEMPVLALTEEMRQKALNEKPRKYPWRIADEYDYNAYFRAAVEKEILRIDIYFTERIRRGCVSPAYRMFFDKKADDFITFDMERQKWRTSRIDNLEWSEDGSYWDDQKLYMEREEKKCVADYLGLARIDELDRWQYETRKKQRMDAYGRKAGKWDAIMEGIPPLPKDWRAWLAKNVITEHYMFYAYKKRGEVTGRCSRCGKKQVLYKPKYNKKGVCRSCHHPVVYKSVGKCGRLLTKYYTAHLLQRMGNRIVSRQFRVYAFYPKWHFDKPELSFWEERRFLLDPDGNGKAYYWGEYKDRKLHWIETDVCRREAVFYVHNPRYFTEPGAVYRRTLPDLAKKELKKTGIWSMAKLGLPFAPEIYLPAVKEAPVIEKAAKAGMGKLALDLTKQSWDLWLSNEGKLHQCLGISRNQLKRLRANNGGARFLAWLQYEWESREAMDDGMIAWFIGAEIGAWQISFLKGRMSPRQVINYLVRQQKKKPDESYSEVLSAWQDYLRMAKKCGLDVNDPIVYRAADLWQRHDEIVQRLEEHKNEYREQELLKQYPNLNQVLASLKEKYSYQDETYAVVVPENVQDLIREGDTLHHCVDKTDNYFERISKGETYILFLRKASELSVPYYTLEVEPGGTIRQKRTEFNRQNEDIKEASAFLKNWQKEVRKRMTKDDLMMAEQSRKIRIEEYEKLRKDKVEIAQGTYGGQLLADLLESDLMEIADAA
ncbi:MAG: PcfJ domain-containing protein [Eubacteriales bacterium]|nr:PcfJ domain-containing protein [Eubacteriales bacterium]